ncbi:MAG: OmpH family outer membrane protein, partial [Candidatus Angelobacter sp.]
GYAVVMDVSNPQTPVLYANPGTNITKNLVEAYNAESPAVAAPKPASKPASKPAGAASARPPAHGGATPKKP